MSGFSAFEYESLPVCKELDDSVPGQRALTEAEVDELYAVGDKIRARIIEQVTRSKVRFRQYVGLIRVAGRDIEILPKIESAGEPSSAGRVRGSLLGMLLVAAETDIRISAEAQALLQKSTWLDAFIQIFCHLLTEQTRKGLIKLYRLESDDLSVVRGRLLLDEQLTRNCIHQERVACEYDELDENHALNQMLKLAAFQMMRMAKAAAVQRQAREVLAEFDAVDLRPVEGGWWRAVRVDRLSSRFETVRRLAEVFLSGLSPSVQRGSAGSYSLLFDMNVLFEEYVGRVLRSVLRTDGLTVHLQHARHHLMSTGDESKRLFMLKPDIVVFDKALPVCIADTKWKQLEVEERKLGVAQSDLYQMLAYAQRYSCDQVLMLYPFDRERDRDKPLIQKLLYQGRSTAVTIGQLCLADLSKVPKQLLSLYQAAVSQRSSVPL